MDLDEADGSSKVATRPRKFAPGRAGKPKPKPKTEPKQEPAEKSEPPSHLDAHMEAVSKREHEVDVKFSASQQRFERADYNGAVKMEVGSAAEKEPETSETQPMDEDRLDQQQPDLEEEEEDLVVREIDVFVNPPIGDDTKLYVLQYPLRPSWRPYELDERCEEVRVKPSTPEVEVDLSMDVNPKNYDKEFGSKLKMTKQTLTTNWRRPPAMDYAVGILMGDKLHLNSVHVVAQLRPSMEYLSSVGKKKQTAAEFAGESVGSSKKQIKGMQSSAEQRTIQEENWVKLKYHGLHSELYSRYLQGMTAIGSSPIDFNMSLGDYIDSLCPGGIRSSRPRRPSQGFFLSLPLEERLRKLLCEGSPLLRYSVLKHYTPDYSDEDVLSVLQQLGLLVQGLWTPKTRLLNLDGPLAGARDYVLTLFSKDPIVKYSQVDAAGRNRDRVKEILITVAKERPLLNDWKFKESTDVSFIKCYPDIVKKQEVVWKSMEDKIMPLIKGARAKVDSRRNINTKLAAPVKSETPFLSDKGATRNAPTPRVRRMMSEETRRALPKALKKVFQTHKVCSFQMICQGLRDLAVSKSNNPKADSSMEVIAAFGADAPPEELKEIISEVAINIHGSYVLKSSPDHPEFDPLRKVVIDLLCGMGPGARLKKAEVLEAGKSVLGREVAGHEYNKVMNDFCESNGGAWVLQKPR